MAATHSCTWSSAVGPVTVTQRDNGTLSFEFQARGDEGDLIGAVHRQTRTFDPTDPNRVHVEATMLGKKVADFYEAIRPNEAWRIAFNRCVNDMKAHSPKPDVPFLRAVRGIAHRY